MPPSLSALRRTVRATCTDPVAWTDAVQVLKTVAAAVVAWLLATRVWDLPQSFLAPWAALLVVHATVYRTFSDGVRQVAAAVLGVVLAWAVGNAIGDDAVAVAVALLVGMTVGSAPWFRGQDTTIAATALIVLTTGFSDNDSVLLSRLLDTGTGIAVGLAVNLAVWPPLRRRTALRTMDGVDDRIGALLQDLAAGLQERCSDDALLEWLDRTRRLDEDLDRAWSLVRQARESARMNPRRSAVALREPEEWYRLLRRMEQAVAESRSMVRTFAQSKVDVNEWEPRFREPYLRLLGDAGEAIARADPDGIAAIRDRLDALVRELSEERLSPHLWPEYGGLVTNLRNIAVAMVEVARTNPLAQPPVLPEVVRAGRSDRTE